MDKNVIWNQISSMLQNMKAEEERMGTDDVVASLNLLSNLIQSCPSLITKVDGLEETSEDNHRTKAFSTYILTKSFHLQSNVKYVKIEADIFSLQKVVMDTLLQLNRSQWKYYMNQLINFALRFVANNVNSLHIFKELFSSKELEILLREERPGHCRMMADLEPEDKLFTNEDHMIRIPGSTAKAVSGGSNGQSAHNSSSGSGNLDKTNGVWYLLSCCNKLILNYLQDIMDNFTNASTLLRKLSLVQLEVPDTRISLQGLQYLAHLNRYESFDFNCVVMELHVVQHLFIQVSRNNFQPEWRTKFEEKLFKYFEMRSGDPDPLPDKILDAFRTKFMHPLANYIMTKGFKGLPVDRQSSLLTFFSGLVSGKDHEDESYRQFLSSSLALGLDKVMVSQVWPEFQGPTRFQVRKRSEKRKSLDDDDLRDEISFDQSRAWKIIEQLFMDNISLCQEPAALLRIMDVFLSAGSQLGARCVKSWPGVALRPFPEEAISKMVAALTSYIQTNKSSKRDPLFYKIIKDLIILTSDDLQHEYLTDLQCLAALLAYQYLDTVLDARQSDLKLGNYGQVLVSLSQQHSGQCISDQDLFESMLPLSMFGKDICPKWRMAVIKSIMLKNYKIVVRCIPFICGILVGQNSSLARDIIQSLNKSNSSDQNGEIGLYSGTLVCCMAKSVKVSLASSESGKLEMVYACARCSEDPQASHLDMTGDGRTLKGTVVEFSDIQPLFKLIGHQDEGVRNSVMKAVVPICNHSFLSNSAAMLILNYINDPVQEIRQEFSQLIGNLLECACSTLEGRDQVSVNIVNRIIELAPDDYNDPIWSTYIPSIVTVYQSIIPLQCQTKLLDSLLGLFFNPPSHQLCKTSCLNILQDALLKEKAQILQFCAKLMCANCKVKKENGTVSPSGEAQEGSQDEQLTPEKVLQYLNLLVPPAEVDSFITANLHHILPVVFQISALKDLKKPIQVLASLKEVRPKALIHEYFTKIYAHVVVTCDDKQFETCIRFLKRETAFDLVDFLNCHRLKSIEELLCVFSCNRDKVIRALRTCAHVDDNFKTKGLKEIDVDKVKEYLSINNNMMATFSSFMVKLSNTTTNTETKLNIVASLVDLCRFLGHQYLAPVKHSLLACLKLVNKLAHKCSSFRTQTVNLWEAFVMNIDLNDIEVILPQILVGLSPFCVTDKEKIIPLYRYLLIEKSAHFKGLRNLMVLVPDNTQELKEIQRRVYGSEVVQFRTILEAIIHNMNHEAVEVRLQTITMLKNLLEANMGALQGMLLRSDQTDSVITDLVGKLMVCMSSREPDEGVRYAASECIGQIGAVDPGKLELEVANRSSITSSKEYKNYILDIKSVEFCVRLIQELVKASQSCVESNHHNICMFSLQNVVKIYQINSKQRNSFADRVLDQLSDSYREIVYPVMSSNYAHQPTTQQEITIPVYGTANGQNYKTWIVNFSIYLVQNLFDSTVKEIFVACMPILKKDLSIAEFLLPHLIIAIISSGGEEGINTVLLEVTTILHDADSTSETLEKFVEGNSDMLVAQALFNFLDHANAWLQAKYALLLAATGKSETSLRVDDIHKATRDKQYAAVNTFLDRISKESLANLSFNSSAYHRAAFYLDRTLSLETLSDPQLNALQKLYAGLEEPDLVVAVAAVRTSEPSLDSQILYNTAIGNFQDALCCFERQDDVDLVNLVQCYLSIDQPGTAARIAAGLVARDKSLEKVMAPLQAEAAWQLGEWKQLEEFTSLRNDKQLQQPDNTMASQQSSDNDTIGNSWEMGLSQAILAAYKADRSAFIQEIQSTRKLVLKSISAISFEQGAYRKTYSQIGRLCMLREVESIAEKILLNKPGESNETLGTKWTSLLEELDARLNYSQVSWGNLEPILRLRRGMFGAALARYNQSGTNIKFAGQLKCEIGECWLKSARIARKACQLQESYSYLLKAEKYHNPKLFIESAELKWKRGKRTEAISTLKKGLKETFPDVMQALEGDPNNLHSALVDLDNQSPGLRDLCAQGKLLLARYVEDAASVGQEGIRKHFDHAKEIVKNSDEIFYYMAKFMDKKSAKMSADQSINQSEIVTHAALTYLRSMRFGPTYLDECMPRMLTIWLDFAATIQEALTSRNKENYQIAALDHATKQLSKLNKTIAMTRTKMPTYYLLTAFPQIVSRICHTNNETYLALKSLMVQVFLDYPQQAAWHMVSVSKNSNTTRKARCNEVFQEVIKSKPSLKTFLTDAISFSQKIDDLCDAKTGDREQESSFRDLLPSMPAMFRSSEMSSIILPIERNMVVNTPTSIADIETHNPFPAGCINIQGVEDRISIMSSLVRPKKITFRGSDGKLYSFLAKPKDDLRRDCRLMDFGNLLNRMFRKEPEARKRGLKMRTYMVVPTNETNGLIEWVLNLKGMRQILIHILKERGVSLSIIHRRYQPKQEDSTEKKVELFTKSLEELKGKEGSSPSVFRDWFVRTFPDPQAWFAARLSFTRTTAVMSIMGYILGLGDRHLENINMDTSTGDTFHVDMNSLFNISETYKVPEVVPFRLTHNQVDGFGPLGIEGPYRISCEVSLRMMREQKDLLMSVLRPFIFDPLVDWRDKSKKKGVTNGEEGNKPGQEALARVQDRLDGLVHSDKKRKGHLNTPLSVEGQVDHVIREAMSIENLSAMYWGWTPFL